MLADELAVDVNISVIIDRSEAQESAFPALGMRGEMALIPDETVVPAHVGRMGDEGLRQLDHRRAVHVIFVQRLWVGPHRRGGVDVVVAAVPRRSLAAVEAGEPVAIRIDRPVPWPIEIHRLAHVGADQHRLRLSSGGHQEDSQERRNQRIMRSIMRGTVSLRQILCTAHLFQPADGAVEFEVAVA